MPRIAQYDLELDLGINASNGSKKLSEVFTGATGVADAKAKLPSLFGWAKYKGWTDAEIMSLYYGEAGWHHCFWAGENGNYNSPAPAHAINITVGAGRYLCTSTLLHASGIYSGAGSRFSDMNGTHSYGSTEWVIDHANWKTKYYKDRIIIKSANWGSDGDGAWVHHYIIQHMHFNGARRTKWWVNDGTIQALVATWDAAEASVVSRCYFRDADGDGLLFARGTPARSEYCSFFTCNRYGAACMGSGNFGFLSPSGDEDGIALVGGGPGFGRPGNAQITITAFKFETSTSAPFQPWKGRPLIHFEGWLTATVNGGTWASGWVFPYAFIVVKPTVNKSSVSWNGVQWFGNAPKLLLYNEVTAEEFPFPGNAYDNAVEQGHWHQDKGMKTDWTTITPTVRAMKGGTLQHVGQDGATDWASAGIYDPTGGVKPPPTTPPTDPPTTPPTEPPVPPTPPSTATPARFTFNQGSASSLNSVEGLKMTQASGTASVSGGKLTVLNNPAGATASWTCNLVGKTITITNFTPSAAVGGQYLFTTSAKKGIVITDGGGIADNTGGSDRMLYPAGTLVAGRNVPSLTLTMLQNTNFVRFGATEGAGNCFKGSIDEMKVS